MALADLISADQIIPEMKATERWDAIVELMDLLVQRGKIRPQDRDGDQRRRKWDSEVHVLIILTFSSNSQRHTHGSDSYFSTNTDR